MSQPNRDEEARIMRQATWVAVAILLAVAGLAVWLATRLS